MMASFDKRHEIMDSLALLDHAQTLRVLDFIQVLMEESKAYGDYETFKREALSQISLALRSRDEIPSPF